MEAKGETLEEAAKKYIETSHYMNNDRKDDIIFGAKWQAKRMYSEEEVYNICYQLLPDKEELNMWFEQFKKK